MEGPNPPSPTQRLLTIDAHMDVPWLVTKHGRVDLKKPQSNRMVDLPRMDRGRLDAAVFALYLSDYMQDEVGEKGSDYLLMHQENWIRSQSGMKVVEFLPGALDAIDAGLVPIFLGLEGGRLIHNDIGRLNVFRNHGVRYLTLTHNRTTGWADSATDDPEHKGLTKFGEEVIMKCEDLDILVDVSHASDDVVEDVLDLSHVPIIASHSGCRSLVDHPRNLSDTLIKAIALGGGVVCVPFAKRFIGPYATGVVDHINRICQLVGDSLHVGIGSDLDGAVMAAGAEDVSKWWDVATCGLDVMGYKSADIDNITGGNLLRILG